MTDRQIVLVQETFRKLAPRGDAVIALFYARLFELDPSLRGFCFGAMEAKSRCMMESIGSVLSRLDRFEELLPALHRLGARQAWRGVRDEHYATAGAAFLWTLEKALGAEFTPPVKSAWNRCYVEIASAMLDGAQPRSIAA